MGAVVTDGIPSLLITVDGSAGIITKVHDPLPEYRGDTLITPTTESIILHTAGKTLYSDITINRIPQNYALITQIGSYIQLS